MTPSSRDRPRTLPPTGDRDRLGPVGSGAGRGRPPPRIGRVVAVCEHVLIGGMELPGWWNYPKHCHHGHPSGPGRVIVSYTPCDCAGARQAGKLGHLLTVNCREPGCTSCWRKPRHDPATATPALRVGRDGLPGSGGAVVV